MIPCPTCGKSVDALRAPAAKVRDGKIVAYCSKECATAADTQPVAKARAASEPAPKARAASESAAKSSRRTPAGGTPARKSTPATGVPKSARDLDSGPVIEIVHEPASGVVTSAADARIEKASTSRRADASGAIEIADTGHIDDYVDPDPPRSRAVRVVLLLLLLVIAGGGFAAYKLGYLDRYLSSTSTSSDTPPESATAPVPAKPTEPEPPPVPVIAPKAALDRARTTLRAQLESATPRVQRLASSALARTGDVAAITQLANALGKETSDLAKVEIAYALARGGDKRGLDVLTAALGSPRRDVRLEAGRRLALLGDKRGAPTLVEYLDVSQLRLGAAEALAYIAEPKALDALDKIRKDEHATADDRARATIALGFGGRADVADALHALLTDARQNAFAANALAVLHDAAARPVLVEQLAIPSLRVGAARGLRILEPTLDPAPLLPPLVGVLSSGKDTEQVQAAEAIFLLAGPATWSEHE